MDEKITQYVKAVAAALSGADLPLGSCDCSECKERVVRGVLATYFEVVYPNASVSKATPGGGS